MLRTEALGGMGGLAIKRRVDKAIEKGELPADFRGTTCRARIAIVEDWLKSGIQVKSCSGHLCVPRDPHHSCAQRGGVGCNIGACENAVFLPEHAPGLAMQITAEEGTLVALKKVLGDSAYIRDLELHIGAEKKILAQITSKEAA